MWQYRWWTWLILPLVALVVETSLLSHLFPPDALPNLVLVVVVALAFFETPRRALILGALAGLLVDVDAGRLIGLNMALFATAGWVVGVLQARIVRDEIFVPGFIGALVQAGVRIVTWGLLLGLGLAFPLSELASVLPVDILFGLFMTPGVIGILRLKPRHLVDQRFKF